MARQPRPVGRLLAFFDPFVTLRTGIRRLLLPLAGPVAERTVRWYVARLKAAAR